jgi:hypothetical protein
MTKKRLPPPGSGNGSKLPTRQPPPGHPALEKEFLVRFVELTDFYDELVGHYEGLKHLDGSHAVRLRMQMLEPSNDEDVFDKLEWLWPNVLDIYAPPRKHYAVRLSLLVGSFPSAAPHSPEVYTNTLLSVVAVKAPSCMVLESAAYELITTYKFSNAPNVADFCSLLDKHDKLWDERLQVQREIESGRAREYAERRLAYEEEQEQKKINRAIARLEKLKSGSMDPAEAERIKEDADCLIAELKEEGIAALVEDQVRDLELDAIEQVRLEEQRRKEASPKYKALQGFLKQFKLKEQHHDELFEILYKEASDETVKATIANGNCLISPDTLRRFNEGLASDNRYKLTLNFIKKATRKTLHLPEPKKEKVRRNEWDVDDDDDLEKGRHGARIRF